MDKHVLPPGLDIGERASRYRQRLRQGLLSHSQSFAPRAYYRANLLVDGIRSHPLFMTDDAANVNVTRNVCITRAIMRSLLTFLHASRMMNLVLSEVSNGRP